MALRTLKLVGGSAALMGLSLVLSACPPAYPKCESDEQCKDHKESCVQGQCVQCATDKNCPENFVCQANKCVPKPECKQDADCPGGGKCEAGQCASSSAENQGCAACGPDEECQDNACVKKGPVAVGDCRLLPIRFGFNDSLLSGEARRALDTAADCLKGAKGKIVLEGHADERGTEEYNLQLSNRRAATVKKYLADLGVTGNKLQAVGYGENKPAVDAHDEEAWAANRRVELTGK
jgi:peptidoglycan-associated lipoprotein